MTQEEHEAIINSLLPKDGFRWLRVKVVDPDKAIGIFNAGKDSLFKQEVFDRYGLQPVAWSVHDEFQEPVRVAEQLRAMADAFEHEAKRTQEF